MKVFIYISAFNLIEDLGYNLKATRMCYINATTVLQLNQGYQD